ncbi:MULTISPECIES: TetR-like C-terminal domain-containing protein [unclassified Streptomyces]
MQAERLYAVSFDGVVESTIRMFREVVERGIERGGVRPDAANGYVSDAIPAMMMYRSTMCGCEWQDQEIEEMIDQLMVPPLRSSGAWRRPARAVTLSGEARVSRAVPGGVT